MYHHDEPSRQPKPEGSESLPATGLEGYHDDLFYRTGWIVLGLWFL